MIITATYNIAGRISKNYCGAIFRRVTARVNVLEDFYAGDTSADLDEVLC